MLQRKSPVVVIIVIASLALLVGCERPTRNPEKLKAIKAEAQMLMKAYPLEAKVADARWPHAIASLEPEFVMINRDGVHITTRAYFDGGWGYFVPRREPALPGPIERFEEAGQGVYWWHPY
jgi:hypothetical protein